MFFNRKRNWLYARIQLSAEKPTTVKWMIKSRIVRSEGQANLLLIALVVVFLWLAFSIFPYTAGGGDTISPEVLSSEIPGFNNEG